MRLSNRVRRVTSFVTKGLPSRSPPIQEPNWKNGGTSKRSDGYACRSARSSLSTSSGTTSKRFSCDEHHPPPPPRPAGGRGEPQLAREPQQLDLGPQVVDQRAALPRSPAGRLEVNEPTIDAAMLLEHRDALGFCRVRGDDGAHAQLGDDRAHLIRRDPVARRGADDLGERAAQPIVSSL